MTTTTTPMEEPLGTCCFASILLFLRMTRAPPPPCFLFFLPSSVVFVARHLHRSIDRSTQPLGTDRTGRQYLVFPADPLSVYVQPTTVDRSQGLAQDHPQQQRQRQEKTRAGGAGGVGGGGDHVWKVIFIFWPRIISGSGVMSCAGVWWCLCYTAVAPKM